MTEEEKKAIEYLKRHILPYYGSKGKIEFMLNDIILNLIDNQQKLIEELKDNYIRLQNTEAIQDIYIKKDKIREKIKYIEDNYSEHSEVRIGKCIEFLNELLEE